MTVPRINALITYWKEQCPPACRSLAAFIGFKPSASSDPEAPAMPEKTAAEKQEDTIREIMAMFPSKPPKPLPFNKPVIQNG